MFFINGRVVITQRGHFGEVTYAKSGRGFSFKMTSVEKGASGGEALATIADLSWNTYGEAEPELKSEIVIQKKNGTV